MTSNKKSILFLDIDGVLNNDVEFERWRNWPDHTPLPGDSRDASWCISQDNMDQLNRIIRETNCTIVLSSTWRTLFPLQLIELHLKKFGFIGELSDKTPDFTWSGGWGGSRDWQPRFKEINSWLMLHKGEYDSYVIVDDLIEADNAMGRYEQTFETKGLTKQNADNIIKLFKAQETNPLSQHV